MYKANDLEIPIQLIYPKKNDHRYTSRPYVIICNREKLQTP